MLLFEGRGEVLELFPERGPVTGQGKKASPSNILVQGGLGVTAIVNLRETSTHGCGCV